MDGMIEAFLMLILVWFGDYQRCTAAEIASIAEEYVPRYKEIETREEWELYIVDLLSEVYSQCEPDVRPEA